MCHVIMGSLLLFTVAVVAILATMPPNRKGKGKRAGKKKPVRFSARRKRQKPEDGEAAAPRKKSRSDAVDHSGEEPEEGEEASRPRYA